MKMESAKKSSKTPNKKLSQQGPLHHHQQQHQQVAKSTQANIYLRPGSFSSNSTAKKSLQSPLRASPRSPATRRPVLGQLQPSTVALVLTAASKPLKRVCFWLFSTWIKSLLVPFNGLFTSFNHNPITIFHRGPLSQCTSLSRTRTLDALAIHRSPSPALLPPTVIVLLVRVLEVFLLDR